MRPREILSNDRRADVFGSSHRELTDASIKGESRAGVSNDCKDCVRVWWGDGVKIPTSQHEIVSSKHFW